ncbi:MAG: TrmH family RNA methyltransferase, partial [Planctomycetota bacterium]
WPAALDTLRSSWDITLLGAAIEPGSRRLCDVERPRRVGLVVGQEYSGLSEDVRACCDGLVRIPMAPGVDSLNVAVAAAVCLERLSNGQRS